MGTGKIAELAAENHELRQERDRLAERVRGLEARDDRRQKVINRQADRIAELEAENETLKKNLYHKGQRIRQLLDNSTCPYYEKKGFRKCFTDKEDEDE